MTMRIKIENMDHARDCKVRTEDVNKETGRRAIADSARIKPGESREFYIHQLRDLHVEEVNPTTDG